MSIVVPLQIICENHFSHCGGKLIITEEFVGPNRFRYTEVPLCIIQNQKLELLNEIKNTPTAVESHLAELIDIFRL